MRIGTCRVLKASYSLHNILRRHFVIAWDLMPLGSTEATDGAGSILCMRALSTPKMQFYISHHPHDLA